MSLSKKNTYIVLVAFFLTIPLCMHASTYSWTAFTFNTNLKEGDRSNDVKELQKLLNESPDTAVAVSGDDSPGKETEYFDSQTKSAVIHFQNLNAKDVMYPLGLTSGNGIVGTTTRNKLNAIGQYLASLSASSSTDSDLDSSIQSLSTSLSSGNSTGSSTSSSSSYSSALTSCASTIAQKYITSLIKGAVSDGFSSIFGSSGTFSSTISSVSSMQTVPTSDKTTQTTLQDQGDTLEQIRKNSKATSEGENVLKSIASCVGNKLMSQITKSTVSWINSGFKNADGTTGSGYVTNLDSYITGVGDRAAGSFLSTSGTLGANGSVICKPYDTTIRKALVSGYQNNTSESSFKTQSTCNLSSIKDSSDLSNIGKSDNYWDDFYNLSQNDNNNFLGSYFNAKTKMNSNVSNSSNLSQQEVSNGGGFINLKKCPNGTSTCKDSEMITTTPGSEVQATLNRMQTLEGQRTNVVSSIDNLIETLMTNLMNQATKSLSERLGSSS